MNVKFTKLMFVTNTQVYRGCKMPSKNVRLKCLYCDYTRDRFVHRSTEIRQSSVIGEYCGSCRSRKSQIVLIVYPDKNKVDEESCCKLSLW